MKRTTKFILFLLVTVMSISIFGTGASAVTYVDGNSTSYNGGSGTKLTGHNYDVLYTSDATIGYRITLLRKNTSGTFDRVGSTDAFYKGNSQYPTGNYNHHLKITAAGKTYYNADKYTLKSIYSEITKVEAQSLGTIGQKFTSAYSYYYGTTASLGVAVPSSASGAKAWAFSEDKMNKVLGKFGSYTMANLKATDYILMEPLYSVTINGTGYSITVTEMALLGRILFGDSSTGAEGNYTGYNWNTICKYTNLNYPKELYTSENSSHSDLEIPDGSNLSAKASFKTIFNNGYGLLIAWNKNPHILTINYDCYGSSPSISSSTYKMDTNEYNRIKLKSNSSYFAQTVKYDNSVTLKTLSYFGITPQTGKHFVGWLINGTVRTAGGSYSASALYSGVATANASVWASARFANNTYTVEYYVDGTKQTSLTQSCTYGTSYSYKSLPSLSTGNHYTDSSWHLSSATGTAKTPGGSFSNLTATNGGTVKLYATTAKNTYTVEYYLDSVKQPSLTQSCVYGTSYSYPSVPASTVKNNKVSGWYNGNSYASKGNSFSAGNSFCNLTLTNGGTVKRYAYSYVVIYYRPNGGTVGSENYTTSSTTTILNASDKSYVRFYMYYGTTLTSYGLSNASTFGLTKTGHSFSSWMAQTDNSKLYDQTTQYGYGDFKNYANSSGEVILYAKWNPNNYTVEYYVDNVKNNSLTQNCKYGTNYTYPALPTAATGKHYTNSNWHLSSATGTAKTPGGSFSNLSATNGATVKFYATTAYNTYTVKYYLDGTEQANLAQSCVYGTSYSYAKLPTVTGATVIGWNSKTDLSGTAYTAEAAYSNLTATNGGTVNRYAKSTSNSYTVRYYLDGVLQSSLTQTCIYDSNYSYKSLPTKTGYSVTGWNNKSDMTGTIYTPGASFTKLSSTSGCIVNRYAKSTANGYKVEYYVDGVLQNSLTQNCKYGTNYTYPTLPMVATGKHYTNSNWHLSSATGTAKTPGSAFSNLSATNGATVKFYATTEYNTYTVKYFLDGTEQTGLTQSCTYGTGYSYKALPTKTGYTVTGWNNKSDMTGMTYTAGGSFSNLTATNGGTVSRYAKSTVNSYTVQYYVDGVLQSSLTQNCKYGTNYTYKALPTKTGYKISGWNSKSDMTGSAYNAGATFGNLSAVNGSIVKRYAVFSPVSYKVRFNSNGGNGTMELQTFMYDEEKNLSANLFERDGFEFIQWNTKADGTGTDYDDAQKVKNLSSVDGKIIDLYAQWEQKSAVLSLKAITPNAPYREKTEVISAFNLINSSVNECKPDDKISVVFKVLKNSTVIKTVTVNNVVVPANEKNLLYFKWTVPELTNETIGITAEIVDGDNHYGQIKKTYSTCEYEISQTPDTQYEASAPENFVMKSLPAETNNTLNWYVWVYSDNAFVKKNYSAHLNANTVSIKPTASANSWISDGKTCTKSGYGIEIDVTDTVSTTLSGSCTGIQYVTATFPEFGYVTTNTKCRTLEKVSGKWVFRTNEDYGRTHFTPLWFPDGNYVSSVVISDCWTPAGMLKKTVNSNEIVIKGSAYDDWWID